MTFPVLFPQYAKSSMDSSTQIPGKIKTVSRIMQKSNTTGTFHYISNSVFKGILTSVGPWRQCRVSLLTMVDGLPRNWIGTLPPLCSKTGDVANA